MNIYLLDRKEGCGYDEADGFVVAALDARQARELASERAGDEGGGTWLAPALSTCHKLGDGPKLKAAVVLRSFNAG